MVCVDASFTPIEKRLSPVGVREVAELPALAMSPFKMTLRLVALVKTPVASCHVLAVTVFTVSEEVLAVSAAAMRKTPDVKT
jgi:hypothetical protein